MAKLKLCPQVFGNIFSGGAREAGGREDGWVLPLDVAFTAWKRQAGVPTPKWDWLEERLAARS